MTGSPVSSGVAGNPKPPVVSRFRRSRDGVAIHRWDCVRASKAMPWRFADGKTDDEVFAAVVAAPWLKPCRLCKPLEAQR